jgi:methylenetetrahydrofolate reductase (NADPH)
MIQDPTIAELLKKNRPIMSVEFYPPKTEEGGAQILATAAELQKHFKPDFVSITYGAGGSTREVTQRYAALLREQFQFPVMPHLTCIGASKDELRDLLGTYQRSGIRNIMALRGDPPKGVTTFTPHPEGLHYASELVHLIRTEFPAMSIGVAAYPEKHPEAVSLKADLDHLRHKVEQGADFITTQLFFENELFEQFVLKCRAEGIQIPILPGILPALSLEQVERFCQMCGTRLPVKLAHQLKNTTNPTERETIGIQWATNQIEDLLRKGVPGIHLYILNRSQPALKLMKQLKAHGLWPH